MVEDASYHGASAMNPFEAVYGQKTPSVLSYLLIVSKVQDVDKTLRVW